MHFDNFKMGRSTHSLLRVIYLPKFGSEQAIDVYIFLKGTYENNTFRNLGCCFGSLVLPQAYKL